MCGCVFIYAQTVQVYKYIQYRECQCRTPGAPGRFLRPTCFGFSVRRHVAGHRTGFQASRWRHVTGESHFGSWG